jgi:hypothetical protein
MRQGIEVFFCRGMSEMEGNEPFRGLDKKSEIAGFRVAFDYGQLFRNRIVPPSPAQAELGRGTLEGLLIYGCPP